MGTRVLKTYRVEQHLVNAVSVQARGRGETVTDVIERAFRAYIQQDAPERGVYTVPGEPVYTPVYTSEASPDPIAALRAQMAGYGAPLVMASDLGSAPEPEKRPCRHPSAAVRDNVCRECGQEVDLR